ncbi:MAG TPA: esterase, partial [Parvularcula sp.]|nr:esterase [Parvularcula sp.]
VIEANYRTSGADAMMGESLAGLFVAETFLKYPETADRYIAISPSLWWDFG